MRQCTQRTARGRPAPGPTFERGPRESAPSASNYSALTAARRGANIFFDLKGDREANWIFSVFNCRRLLSHPNPYHVRDIFCREAKCWLHLLLKYSMKVDIRRGHFRRLACLEKLF